MTSPDGTGPVAVLDDHQRCAHRFADWASLGRPVDFVAEHLVGDDLVARIGDAEVVVAMRERTAFDADLLDRLPRLRLLVTTGMANAAIDLDAARDRGVVVCGTGGVDGSTAEHTWALLLAVQRRLVTAAVEMRVGRWQDDVPPGVDLEGARLGVVGLGRLGTRVARVGLAFGMRVQAWSQHLDADHARSLGVEPVGRDELLATSDVVTLHLRLSARTRGLLGAAELAAMKPGAVLVNTSRGPLVDEAALVAALREGRLAGAGLDVYDTEPLPADHPLRTLPTAVLTPHLGYVTEATYRSFYGDAVEDVAAFTAGAPVRVLGA